ncbi:hypothetical protein QYF36_015830 [Acer negundo]|nr:hypothetical protein QYF36_015830 [Acer negundo]
MHREERLASSIHTTHLILHIASVFSSITLKLHWRMNFKGNQIVIPECIEKNGQEKCSFNLFVYVSQGEVVNFSSLCLVFHHIGKSQEEEAQGIQIPKLDRLYSFDIMNCNSFFPMFVMLYTEIQFRLNITREDFRILRHLNFFSAPGFLV